MSTSHPLHPGPRRLDAALLALSSPHGRLSVSELAAHG